MEEKSTRYIGANLERSRKKVINIVLDLRKRKFRKITLLEVEGITLISLFDKSMTDKEIFLFDIIKITVVKRKKKNIDKIIANKLDGKTHLVRAARYYCDKRELLELEVSDEDDTDYNSYIKLIADLQIGAKLEEELVEIILNGKDYVKNEIFKWVSLFPDLYHPKYQSLIDSLKLQVKL